MEPTGVLVLRVWRETDVPGALRVRITKRLDVVSATESTETFDITGGLNAVCDSVREFLLTFSERT